MIALAEIALKAGFPLVQKILSGRIGDTDGRLAADVVEAIAARAGVTPAELDQVEETAPGRVIEAMRVVEATVAPEKIALAMNEAEAQLLMFQAEQAGPAWVSAWRPAGMYMLGFLWLWNAVILHVANAFWRIALPPMPFEQLIQLSGLYMGLYMGGHTVKDVVQKWVGK